MVLLAMFRVAGKTTKKLAYEDIALRAWQDFPEAFSLRNHPAHPEPSDIHKRIYGNLVKEGLAKSLGNKFFRLTDEGVVKSASLETAISGKTTKKQIKERLSRAEEEFYRHAIRSRTYQNWQEEGPQSLVDFDVRLFFQFGVSTATQERRKRADWVISMLQKAKSLKANEAGYLLEVAKYLRSNFEEVFKEEE